MLGVLVGAAARCGHTIVPLRGQAYFDHMTKLLDQALEAVRQLPTETQDAIASAMLALAGTTTDPVVPNDEEEAAIARSKTAARRGEFASEEQVRNVWRKHGL
jgi:hypothetical protein